MRDQPGNEPKKGEMEALTVKLPEKSHSGHCLINTVRIARLSFSQIKS